MLKNILLYGYLLPTILTSLLIFSVTLILKHYKDYDLKDRLSCCIPAVIPILNIILLIVYIKDIILMMAGKNND